MGKKKSVEQILLEAQRAEEEAMKKAEEGECTADDQIDDGSMAEKGTSYSQKGTMPGSASAVTLYLSEIKNIKQLTPEEYDAVIKRVLDAKLAAEQLEEYEHELGDEEKETLQKLVEDGDKARETLVEKNLWFVVYMIKQFIGKGVPFADLIQEGNCALQEASKGFDPEKGKFTTYAGRCIRSAIIRVVREEQWGPISYPGHVMAEQAHVQKSKRVLEAQGENAPTSQQIADISGIRADRVDTVQTAWNESRIVSISTPIMESHDSARGDDRPVELGEIIPGEMDEEFIVSMNDRASKRKLLQLMRDVLSPIEELCLVLIYGFEDGVPRGCKEVGEELGYAKSGIIAICNRAEEKLRAATSKCNLRAIFYDE